VICILLPFILSTPGNCGGQRGHRTGVGHKHT
jgi:hypothetical protein